MASVTMKSPFSKLRPNETFSHPTRHSHAATNKAITFFGSKLSRKPLSLAVHTTSRLRPQPVISASAHTFDVVIIGAGIIGLTIARHLLIESDLSVAVVDKAVPCSGATGAGQGYIWMVHKSPESDSWGLAARSQRLWKMFAESVRDQGRDPFELLGWKKNGSLLVGRTHEEAEMLKRKVKQLSEAGLRAEYLSSHDLLSEEPELVVGKDGGAAFLPDDCQIDATRAVATIEKVNQQFASKGRFAGFYHDPVTSIVRYGSNGEAQGVQTSKRTLYSKTIIVAAGSWSGYLLRDLFKGSDIELDVPVRPRKGHLLVLENFSSFSLNHGLMEVGYISHLDIKEPKDSASGLVQHGNALSVSMAATMDTSGRLVLGSSREFAGFNTEVNDFIVSSIWKRAGDYLPKLKGLSLTDITAAQKVRIGLRPYMPDGKPVIGRVPALSNMILATGHEGCGLSLALGTAEMVAHMLLGKPKFADHAAFSVHGRG
ncbi:hypothetical protein K2173_000588 [Erythroxylum novogranatense]|uniref:FAD-dependent oxidoreductase domain-containing protein 1 n=1 Tax=Erythroxylum novogranatense TaxID=1862640 RepID=A0AAV8S7Q5_9ROSI|nr:hypothetical protein K2173_000588 [Erythroxylum novogranatense]